MGIQGLLPLLKKVIIEKHISSFKNKKVAVDTYAWLHKAMYGCSSEIANGEDNIKW